MNPTDPVQSVRGSSDSTAPVRISVHGPNVQRETVEQVGREFAGLLDTVSESMTGQRVGLEVVGVRFMCDGCELTQDFDDSRDGWTHRDGDDFCPACSLPQDQDGDTDG